MERPITCLFWKHALCTSESLTMELTDYFLIALPLSLPPFQIEKCFNILIALHVTESF